MSRFQLLPVASLVAATFAATPAAFAGTLVAQASPPGASASASAPVSGAAPVSRASTADRKFVTKATEGGVKEITLSKMALERSQSADVKDYARMIIDDHTDAGQQLAGIVERQHLPAPTQKQAADKAASDGARFNKLSGAAFDRRYLQTMIADHESTIRLFAREAKNKGQNSELTAFAAKTLPTLKQHLAKAKDLESKRPGAPNALAAVAPGTAASADSRHGNDDRSEAAADGAKHVSKALETLNQMQKDPEIKAMLARSKGVFIIPDYGRAALGVGAQGGAGVLMLNHDGKWTGPGFYNFGGVSVGVQAGVSAGAIAMLLMDDKAVKSFAQNNKFSLNADAGLSIVNYSRRAHGEAGRGDIVVWSDTEGAFANVSLSVTDVNFDENETAAYFGKSVMASDVVNGSASTPKASRLAGALRK